MTSHDLHDLMLVAAGGVGIMILVLVIRHIGLYREEKSWADLYQYAARNAAQQPKPSPAPAKLHKELKLDNAITSGQVTLVATHLAARDEFFGAVEVLDGHQPYAVATRRYQREATILKSWEFLGGADRYDSVKRFAEFAELIQVFKAETQIIVSEFRGQGWTVTPLPEDREGEVYHLNR